jgi:mRNA interferase MazF
MTAKRGEIWLANLDPTHGSEQAGKRPVLVIQNDLLNRYTSTIVAIPLTTNTRRAALPMCLQIAKGEGGLDNDSVALCHQIRVLDKGRLEKKLGRVQAETIANIESRVLFTLGIG